MMIGFACYFHGWRLVSFRCSISDMALEWIAVDHFTWLESMEKTVQNADP